MKNPSDQNPLLDDILGEGNPPEFGNGLLDEMLRHVRHRKRIARRNRFLLAAAILLGVPLMLWKVNSPSSRPNTSELRALEVISSRSITSSMIVETRIDAVILITSTDANLAVVHSRAWPESIQEINDQELLALLAGRPAALVREGPGRAQLLFLDPEDEQGFPVH